MQNHGKGNRKLLFSKSHADKKTQNIVMMPVTANKQTPFFVTQSNSKGGVMHSG